MKKSVLFIASLAITPSVSFGQGLILEYCVDDLGGLYEYHFTLKPDAGWQPGMGWRWFIFGDEPCPTCFPSGTGVSPLQGFQMTSSFPVGPWTSLSGSAGGHNGPTFSPVLDYWIPNSGSETLTWSGTHTNKLGQGQLLFSTLAGTLGGAIAANWNVATLISCSGCYPDCDGSGTLDLFDFLCFVNEFNNGNTYADCDGNGTLDLFDFLCFVNAFNAGC